jgi:hypothetical protein
VRKRNPVSDIGVGYLIGLVIGGVLGFVLGRMIIPLKALSRDERSVQIVLIIGLLVVLIGGLLIFFFFR